MFCSHSVRCHFILLYNEMWNERKKKAQSHCCNCTWTPPSYISIYLYIYICVCWLVSCSMYTVVSQPIVSGHNVTRTTGHTLYDVVLDIWHGSSFVLFIIITQQKNIKYVKNALDNWYVWQFSNQYGAINRVGLAWLINRKTIATAKPILLFFNY